MTAAPAGPLAPLRVGRRRFLRLAFTLLAGAVLAAHTPYRQWAVYRRQHLLILTDRSDPRSEVLGRLVAELLAEHLPESRARVARAAGPTRVASLIGSAQLDVALVHERMAEAMLRGDPALGLPEPVPVRALVRLGDHVVISRADFAVEHARAVAETLLTHGLGLPVAPQASADLPAAIPWHAGIADG